MARCERHRHHTRQRTAVYILAFAPFCCVVHSGVAAESDFWGPDSESGGRGMHQSGCLDVTTAEEAEGASTESDQCDPTTARRTRNRVRAVKHSRTCVACRRFALRRYATVSPTCPRPARAPP
eukprot:3513319-Prymnesium_polylepis.1